MTKKFDDVRTDQSRALQVYLILIGVAHERRILTYGHLADILGFKGAGVLAGILGHIMYWCEHNKLPPLTSIVVNQESGLPGEGLESLDDLNAVREKVFSFDWYSIYPPNEQELERAFSIGMGRSR